MKYRMLRDASSQRALNEFHIGHREGFDYHQRVYYKDPDVKAWVHRERYF